MRPRVQALQRNPVVLIETSDSLVHTLPLLTVNLGLAPQPPAVGSRRRGSRNSRSTQPGTALATAEPLSVLVVPATELERQTIEVARW
jgi:hypothetical protein